MRVNREEKIQYFSDKKASIPDLLAADSWEELDRFISEWTSFVQEEGVDESDIQQCINLNAEFLALIYPAYLQTQEALQQFNHHKNASEIYNSI